MKIGGALAAMLAMVSTSATTPDSNTCP